MSIHSRRMDEAQPKRIVGWEWGIGSTIHYWRWRGPHRGYLTESSEDFVITFNPIRE